MAHQIHSGDLTMSTAARQQASSSPFLNLPAELRNRIYEYVLDPKPRMASLRTSREYMSILTSHTLRFTAEYNISVPAILATCRAIRTEASGEFLAHHPYKIAVHAWGYDGVELQRSEGILFDIFSRLEHEGPDQLEGCDPLNYRAWKRALLWLQDAQAKLSSGGIVTEMSIDFDYGGTVVRCTISRIPRDPKRGPWDTVKGGSRRINTLISGVERSWGRDHWQTT